MNTTVEKTVEDAAKSAWQKTIEPGKVRVRVPVRWHCGICLPDQKSQEFEEALFEELKFGDNAILENAVTFEVEGDGPLPVRGTDMNEFRRLLVKKSLLWWSLDVPIERENGWMTKGCYEKASRIPAPLMEAFIDEFEESVTISKDEEELIVRQAEVLFAKNSRGVTDACEAVSMYCTFGNFWEKFGIDRSQLPNMPMREYLLLKIMMGREGITARRNAKPKQHSYGKIATARGTHPSRAVVVGGG